MGWTEAAVLIAGGAGGIVSLHALVLDPKDQWAAVWISLWVIAIAFAIAVLIRGVIGLVWALLPGLPRTILSRSAAPSPSSSSAGHVRGGNLAAPDSDGEQAVCATCSWKGPFREKLAERRLIDADFGAHLKDPETTGSPIGKYVDAPGTPLRGSHYLTWAAGDPAPPGSLPAAPSNLTVRLVPELGSPVMDEIAYATANRPHRPVDCGGQPRSIRFSEPRDQLVTAADLGELAIPCGQGRLVVERFYDRGVVIDERGTTGDNVRLTAYFDD